MTQDVTVDVVLPTGAMRNIADGYMAKRIGIPFGRLCSGVNINRDINRILEIGGVAQPTEPIVARSVRRLIFSWYVGNFH